MRVTLAAVAFVAFVIPAIAQEPGPFDGRWAWDPEICANERGSGDLVPSEFRGTSVEHYESRCDISSLTPIGDMEQAWEATLTCSGEGEEWTVDVIYALDSDPDGKPGLLIEIDRTDGMVVVRHYCE